MKFSFFKIGWVLLLILSLYQSPLKSQIRSDTQPGNTKVNGLEQVSLELQTEHQQAENFISQNHEKLLSYKDDQKVLSSRIEEGKKELETASQEITNFLSIEQIALTEFKPYLQKWQLMCQSYEEVSGDLQRQSDEVNQLRIQYESKLKLSKFKEGEARLAYGKLSKSEKTTALTAELNVLKNIAKLYEDEKTLSESILFDMGKNSTQLNLSQTQCQSALQQIEQRWRKIRFSRLKVKEESKFSLETLTLAQHELRFRIRNYPAYLNALKDYTQEIWQQLKAKPVFFLICLLALSTAIGTAILLRKTHFFKTTAPEQSPVLEKFLRRLGQLVIRRAFGFIFLGLWILCLSLLPSARQPLGLYLFFCSLTFYLSLNFYRIFSLVFYTSSQQKALIEVPQRELKSASRWLKIFLWALSILIWIQLANFFLEYESEASRFLKWILQILIFVSLFYLTHPKILNLFTSPFQKKYFQFLRTFIRFSSLILLTLIIGLDGLGYTNLSDYLAEGSLKTLGLIPIFLFLKTGLREWMEARVLTKMSQQLRVSLELRLKWKKTLQTWLHWGLIAGFCLSLTRIWDITQEALEILKRIASAGFKIGGIQLSLGLLVSVFLVFYISILASRLVRSFLEGNLYPKKPWDPGVREAINTGTHYLLILVGFLICLRFLGFDIQNITVLAGAFGVGLGFGLQNLANNFVSGIVLLIERPIRVGDTIQVGELTGKVKKIGARSTALDMDQATVLIPNGELLSAKVTNWTYGNAIAAVHLPLKVGFETNLQTVRQLLLDLAHNHPKVLKNPPSKVDIQGFGEFGLSLQLKVWVHDFSEKGEVQSDLYEKIERAFKENQISISYPHREIVVRDHH